MSMLFATDFPDSVHAVITLDHRRMPIPRSRKPKMLSIRGNDYAADSDVIPDKNECERHAIRIVNLEDVGHSDMDDKGTRRQHARIIRHILDFLEP